MMLGAATYLVLLLLIGYPTLSAIAGRQRRSLWRSAGTVAALGAGQMGFLLLCWSLVGGRPTDGVVCALDVMALAATLWLWRTGRLLLPELRADSSLATTDRWVIAPAVAISGVVALVALLAIGNPVIDWDAFAIWGTKARWLLAQPLTPRPALFSDLSLSYSHLDYPLLFPFLTAGAYAMAGGPIEQAGQFLCPFLLAALASILYDGVRDYLPRLPSAFLVLVVMLLPQTLYFAPTGQAALPLLVFYAGSLVALARWTNSGGREHVILLALFSVFLALTKNEGLALAVINGTAVLSVCLFRGTRRRWLDCGLGIGMFVVLVLPWTLWNWSTPRSHEDYGSLLRPGVILGNHDRLPAILAHLQRSFLDAHSFGWFWLLLPLLAVAGYRAWRKADVRVLWFAWLAHISLYVLIFMVTPWELQELLKITSARLLLHAVPAATLIAACHWSSVRGAPS
jgi:hypothetical protein